MATLVALVDLVVAIRADARQVDQPVAPLVDLMVRAPAPAEIDRDETVPRRIDRGETATDPIRPAPLAMATVPIHRVPPVMAIRVHVAMVIRGQRAPAETDPIHLVPHGTAIRAHVVMAIVHTLLDLPAMVTDLTHLAHHAMAILVHATPAATATALAALRALEATDRTRLVRLVMVTGRTLRGLLVMVTPVHAATATGLAPTDHGAIAPMVTVPAGTGSPRAVSVVRSGRK